MSGSDFGSPPSTAARTSFAPSAGSARTSSEVCPALSTSQEALQMQRLCQSLGFPVSACLIIAAKQPAAMTALWISQQHGRSTSDCAGG